jgi:hypothetical protein
MTVRQCFGIAFGTEITKQMNAECEKTAGASSLDNLPIYNHIQDKMYDDASEETKTKYEEEARMFNMQICGPPDESEIYV